MAETLSTLLSLLRSFPPPVCLLSPFLRLCSVTGFCPSFLLSQEDVDDELSIARYRRFNKAPSRSESTPSASYSQEEFDARKDRWYAESPTFKTKNKLRDCQ